MTQLGPRHTDDLLATLKNAREFCLQRGATDLADWLQICRQRVQAKKPRLTKVLPRRGTPIVCHWMRKSVRGKIAERVEITLSPAQCAHFRIWEPRLLDRFRAARIEEWGRQHALKEWP